MKQQGAIYLFIYLFIVPLLIIVNNVVVGWFIIFFFENMGRYWAVEGENLRAYGKSIESDSELFVFVVSTEPRAEGVLLSAAFRSARAEDLFITCDIPSKRLLAARKLSVVPSTLFDILPYPAAPSSSSSSSSSS